MLPTPDIGLPSIALLHPDNADERGATADCADVIFAASTVATLLFWLLSLRIGKRTQAWKA